MLKKAGLSVGDVAVLFGLPVTIVEGWANGRSIDVFKIPEAVVFGLNLMHHNGLNRAHVERYLDKERVKVQNRPRIA